MAVLTDSALTTEANVIKNETADDANTASRVGQMLLDLIDSKLNANAAPAKLYAGIMAQSGTAAPTATVAANSFTTTIGFIRGSAGLFTITSTSEFPIGKTLVFFGNGLFGGRVILGSRQNDSQISFTTLNSSGTAADGQLDTCSIRIEVYA